MKDSVLKRTLLGTTLFLFIFSLCACSVKDTSNASIAEQSNQQQVKEENINDKNGDSTKQASDVFIPVLVSLLIIGSFFAYNFSVHKQRINDLEIELKTIKEWIKRIKEHF